MRTSIRTHRLPALPPALIYNNVSGALNASIEGSTATIPCGGLSMEDAQAIFALCQKNEAGLYTCTLKVTNGLHVNNGEDVKYPTMSDFSSWGTTDDLTIKPEITAPRRQHLLGQRPVEGNRRL